MKKLLLKLLGFAKEEAKSLALNKAKETVTTYFRFYHWVVIIGVSVIVTTGVALCLALFKYTFGG